jgi:hypothetical protein
VYVYIVIDRNRDQRPERTGYVTCEETLCSLSVIATVTVVVVVVTIPSR